MVQQKFAEKAKLILENDEQVLGLLVGGSWLTNEIDEYSDLDLIVVTQTKISDDRAKMLNYAKKIGNFISGFTGEHVGEPRLLICLYDNPLLHVDIKFITLNELNPRVETPFILFDKQHKIKSELDKSEAKWPVTDFQWIEDRFWTWIHYTLLKIGRGEYLEALDFFSYLRMVVLGPLLQIKNNAQPRAVRKVEFELNAEDLESLKETIPSYNRDSLLKALQNCIELYLALRMNLFDKHIKLQVEAEKKVMEFYKKIRDES